MCAQGRQLNRSEQHQVILELCGLAACPPGPRATQAHEERDESEALVPSPQATAAEAGFEPRVHILPTQATVLSTPLSKPRICPDGRQDM